MEAEIPYEIQDFDENFYMLYETNNIRGIDEIR